MRIYLETKSADAHRIVFVGKNGKLVYAGEWVRRQGDARRALSAFATWAVGPKTWPNMWLPEHRPYKPGNFTKNSGPKRKPKTFIALAGKYKGQKVTARATPVELKARKDSRWITNPDGSPGTSLKAHLKPVKSTTKSGKR